MKTSFLQFLEREFHNDGAASMNEHLTSFSAAQNLTISKLPGMFNFSYHLIYLQTDHKSNCIRVQDHLI